MPKRKAEPGAAAEEPAQEPVRRSGAAAEEGYRGFGSFHSDNVQEMVEAEHWAPPASPVPEVHPAGPCPTFGSDEMRRAFLLDLDSWTFLNRAHG